MVYTIKRLVVEEEMGDAPTASFAVQPDFEYPGRNLKRL